MEPLLFGLTGIMGAGKSLASKLLAEDPDVLVSDTDTIAKDIVLSGLYTAEIENILGCTIELHLDVFKKIASIIFSNTDILKRYQDFIHPLVWKTVNEKRNQSSKTIHIVESAILFETGGYTHVDNIIVVTTSYENQMKRLREFRKMTDTEISDRLSKQMPQDEKINRADFILENNGTIDDIKHQVTILLSSLKQLTDEN